MHKQTLYIVGGMFWFFLLFHGTIHVEWEQQNSGTLTQRVLLSIFLIAFENSRSAVEMYVPRRRSWTEFNEA